MTASDAATSISVVLREDEAADATSSLSAMTLTREGHLGQERNKDCVRTDKRGRVGKEGRTRVLQGLKAERGGRRAREGAGLSEASRASRP